jgi:hypothetical protein
VPTAGLVVYEKLAARVGLEPSLLVGLPLFSSVQVTPREVKKNPLRSKRTGR